MADHTVDYWRGRRVFLTGCTGLLGATLARDLHQRGADIVGLVRDQVPQSSLVTDGTISRITTVRGDIEDLALLQRVISEYEVEVVFHLAAQAIVGTANRHPVATFRTNIAGSWNVFEACRHSPRVRAVVVASSDKAYGTNESLPYVESMPMAGEHPYDVSKSCTDLLARTYYATYGLPVCITRCGNFFGGGDLNFNRIVPGTIRSVLHDERPIIRSDGTFVRDYIYVRDVADAYRVLAERMQDPAVHGEAFNFSNEIRLDVLGLTNRILALMGREDLEPVILNEASSEIREQYLSATRARERLGWKPRFGLDDGLRETIDWYRDFFTKRAAAS
ncbi:MAG: NAD-dependent epimerase/dehydratase family protein [Ectothiorhodospiraceae bacterium]|nr:NAD-dependent epimerase/dehydratase family protein [Ectothiorhodospiraceae bacterium]